MAETKSIPYDVQWKQVISAYFESFVAFFLPDLFKDVDFSYKAEFLDKELHELIADKEKGKREGDQLVKVRLKSGKFQWIFVHIEVQSYHDSDFALRMYTTNYRVWDRHRLNIVALAIFTTKVKMVKEYKRTCYGTELLYKYKNYYIKDQKGREKELEASNNIFGLVVLASLYAQKTDEKDKNTLKKRLHFKQQLIRLMIKRGYAKENIKHIFIFINEILKLPKYLQKQFVSDLRKITGMSSSPIISKSTIDLVNELSKTVFGKSFEEQQKTLKEKDAVLKEKDAVLKERDAVLKEKDAVLKEKDAVLKEKDAVLKEKDATIAKLLSEKRSLIIRYYKSHPLATVSEIAEVCGVDLEVVKEIIDEENE